MVNGEITATCSGEEDNAGNSGSASVTYNVHYAFGGWQAPVNGLPFRNTVKAGRAIPVKFSLAGDQSLDIFATVSATSSNKGPVWPTTTCTTAETDPVEETLTAGSSSLSYDALKDTYTYVWKTDSKWAGSCRMFRLNLNDGSSHSFLIQLLKYNTFAT